MLDVRSLPGACPEPLPHKELAMSDLFRIPNEINPDEPPGLTPDMNPIDDATLRDQELERLEHEGDEDEGEEDEGEEAGQPG
jgi:hypothetical protein